MSIFMSCEHYMETSLTIGEHQGPVLADLHYQSLDDIVGQFSPFVCVQPPYLTSVPLLLLELALLIDSNYYCL